LLTSRREKLKAWTARIAFGASIFALLGTSRPRWSYDAKFSGAHDGGAPTKPNSALLVRVESSQMPSLSYTNRFGSRIEPPWGRLTGFTKDEPGTRSFLLPPGAALQSLTLTGSCNSGFCSGEKCVPPPNAYLRATIEHVSVWTKTTRLVDQKVIVQSGPVREGEKTQRTPHLVIDYEGDNKAEVILSSSMAKFPGGDWNGKPFQFSSCIPSRTASESDANSVGTGTGSSDAGGSNVDPTVFACSHYPFNKAQKEPIEITLTVEATVYGACPDPALPCAPPPDEDVKPARIVSVRSTSDY